MSLVAMDPLEELLLGPVVSVPEALDAAGVPLGEVGVWEVHEAFAAPVLAFLKLLADKAYCRERLGRKEALGRIDPKKVNAWGGSLALGHPFGATGARLVTTCVERMEREGAALRRRDDVRGRRPRARDGAGAMRSLTLKKRDDGVAVLLFDTPKRPVNVLSQEMLDEAGPLMEEIQDDDDDRRLRPRERQARLLHRRRRPRPGRRDDGRRGRGDLARGARVARPRREEPEAVRGSHPRRGARRRARGRPRLPLPSRDRPPEDRPRRSPR